MTDSPIHILLLEDDAAHAELVQRAFELRNDNVRLSVASTLQQAYARLKSDAPHLIIADWRLPDGEGIDLLLGRHNPLNVPVVMMTSYGNERIAVEAMKAGALDYVVKSEETLVDMPHIAERAIQQWLMVAEKTRMENQLRENEERFRSFIEQSYEGVALVDEQGLVIEWNRSNEKITGLGRDEVMGTPFWNVLQKLIVSAPQNTDVFSLYKQKITGALQDSQVSDFDQPLEATILTPTGVRRVIQQTLFPIKTTLGLRLGSVTRDVTERRQREHELQAIATLSEAMRTAPTRAEMLPVILDQLVMLLNGDAAMLEMIDPATGDAIIELSYGKWNHVQGKRIPYGKGLNTYLVETNKPYLCNDLATETGAYFPEVVRQCRSIAGVAMSAQKHIIGFLWVGRQTEIAQDEVRLLSAAADIAANAIHRATLHEQTQHSAEELAQAYDATIEGWSRVMDLRDNETEGHSKRVAKLALKLARDFGMSESELVHMWRGALLHDLGKMAIPDHILRKPGPLTDDEWRVMRQHPEYARMMLEPIEYLKLALDIPYAHHERWNGSGYPRGIKEDKIPLPARIFAVVDVWDALRSDRPYRRSWSKNAVIDYMRANSGTEFDPRVVDVFLQLVDNESDSI